MVGNDEDALPLAVVEDDGGFGGGEGWGLRVADGFGVDALRGAEPGAYEVEVVDAVIEDLESGCGGEEGP